jgi:undecaprenyl-diphosphatase
MAASSFRRDLITGEWNGMEAVFTYSATAFSIDDIWDHRNRFAVSIVQGRKMAATYFRHSLCVLMIIACSASVSLTAEASAFRDADHDLFRYIHEDLENGFLDATTPVIQRMGDSQVYTGVCMLLCAFGDERMAETGKLAAAAFMEAGFVAYILKQTVGRPRPLDEDRTETDSFPSGHTTFAFTMATVAGHKYTKFRIPLYIVAAGTAFSRIYLGRHYPSDVVAGALIGTLAGIHVIHCEKAILSISF